MARLHNPSMTFFTVLVVAVFVLAAVAGGKACDRWVSDLSPALHVAAVAFSAGISGALAVWLYFRAVDRLTSRCPGRRRPDSGPASGLPQAGGDVKDGQDGAGRHHDGREQG